MKSNLSLSSIYLMYCKSALFFLIFYYRLFLFSIFLKKKVAFVSDLKSVSIFQPAAFEIVSFFSLNIFHHLFVIHCFLVFVFQLFSCVFFFLIFFSLLFSLGTFILSPFICFLSSFSYHFCFFLLSISYFSSFFFPHYFPILLDSNSLIVLKWLTDPLSLKVLLFV